MVPLAGNMEAEGILEKLANKAVDNVSLVCIPRQMSVHFG